jgi:transcriptional regulator with XRE-family HTH domain
VTAWANQIRHLREQEGLTREQLAHLASVAPATVKAYELGHRNPSRHLLTALLDALKADMFLRHTVLTGAGFAPDGRTPAERLPDEYFSFEEAVLEIDRSPLPACVLSENMEIVAANRLLQRVWEVDLARELQGPYERSLVSTLSTPRTADRIRNWDEAMSLAISIIKGHYGGEAAFASNPYFAGAIEHFLAGDPGYVQRFLALWETTPARQRKLRFSFPVTMLHSQVGEVRFHVQVNPADQRGSFTFNDWIPLDAPTWDRVARLAHDDTVDVQTFALDLN